VADPADAEIVAGLRRGDEGAFDAAYALHGRRIYSFLARLCGRRDLADDIYQETWIKLARHATRLADDTDLAAWLYTVARNQLRSYHRWRVLDADRLRELGFLPSRSGDPSPFDAVAADATRAELEQALGELSPANREVLLLVVVEGLGQEQVAKVLGIEHDAVRQRLSRARAQLAERLAASDGKRRRAAGPGGPR
jgi:RNA polymerase sigma-70 factor (ECF subfamily)